MGRAEVNQDRFLHRMEDLRASLYRALRLLHLSGREADVSLTGEPAVVDAWRAAVSPL